MHVPVRLNDFTSIPRIGKEPLCVRSHLVRVFCSECRGYCFCPRKAFSPRAKFTLKVDLRKSYAFGRGAKMRMANTQERLKAVTAPKVSRMYAKSKFLVRIRTFFTELMRMICDSN